jgi:hypothetical protein
MIFPTGGGGQASDLSPVKSALHGIPTTPCRPARPSAWRRGGRAACAPQGRSHAASCAGHVFEEGAALLATPQGTPPRRGRPCDAARHTARLPCPGGPPSHIRGGGGIRGCRGPDSILRPLPEMHEAETARAEPPKAVARRARASDFQRARSFPSVSHHVQRAMPAGWVSARRLAANARAASTRGARRGVDLGRPAGRREGVGAVQAHRGSRAAAGARAGR